MADSSDNLGDGEKTEHVKASAAEASGEVTETPAAEGASGSASFGKNLPMVLSPKLGAGEDETVEESANTAGPERATAAAPARSTRFLMLAASVAFAAAFGSFVGSVSGTGFAHVFYPAGPPSTTAQANVDAAATAFAQMKLELSALIKADLDATSRTAGSQFAKIADRLDKLDRHFASADTTGSIASQPAGSSAAPAAEPPKLNDRILADWIVHDVRNGRALIESRYGGIFDVGTGSVLPGLGRVDQIKRQDGQWLVLTAHGTITSGR
jgi:hypothetical protein